MKKSRYFPAAFAGLRLLTLGAIVACPAASYAWETVRDFNSGREGEVAMGHGGDGFDDAARMSYYDSSVSAEGGQSARLSISEGNTGFGDWGGIIYFDRDIVSMTDFWFQMDLFLPEDFEIRTDAGSLKMIRFQGVTADGDHGGMLDIQLLDDRQRGGDVFRMIRESSADDAEWYYMGSRKSFTKGSWHRITVNLFGGTKPVDQGGTSYVKMWVDGEMVGYDTSIKTLPNPGDRLVSLYLFTYWNGGAPRDQHVWVDDIRMSTEFPEWARELHDDEKSRRGK